MIGFVKSSKTLDRFFCCYSLLIFLECLSTGMILDLLCSQRYFLIDFWCRSVMINLYLVLQQVFFVFSLSRIIPRLLVPVWQCILNHSLRVSTNGLIWNKLSWSSRKRTVSLQMHELPMNASTARSTFC